MGIVVALGNDVVGLGELGNSVRVGGIWLTVGGWMRLLRDCIWLLAYGG